MGCSIMNRGQRSQATGSVETSNPAQAPAPGRNNRATGNHTEYRLFDKRTCAGMQVIWLLLKCCRSYNRNHEMHPCIGGGMQSDDPQAARTHIERATLRGITAVSVEVGLQGVRESVGGKCVSCSPSEGHPAVLRGCGEREPQSSAWAPGIMQLLHGPVASR
jgi:hypothetical protein